MRNSSGSAEARCETAVVASGHCESLAAIPGLTARAVGSVERNVLPDTWADCVVGHCVLDELDTPLAAFAELARTAVDGASMCVSGPVSAGREPVQLGRVAGGHTTFWPLPRLIDDLGQSGFGGVNVRDLTGELLPRLREAGVAGWWPPEARWMLLEATRVVEKAR
jgi:hypothetical protein